MQRPHKAYPVELAQFHSADYVEFLHRITSDTQHLFSNELVKCMSPSLSYIYIYIFKMLIAHMYFRGFITYEIRSIKFFSFCAYILYIGKREIEIREGEGRSIIFCTSEVVKLQKGSSLRIRNCVK